MFQVQGFRIRLSFYGYSETYDFWRNADSPLIFPCGFCKETNRTLQHPKASHTQSFDWKEASFVSHFVPAPKEHFIVTKNTVRLIIIMECSSWENWLGSIYLRNFLHQCRLSPCASEAQTADHININNIYTCLLYRPPNEMNGLLELVESTGKWLVSGTPDSYFSHC